MKIATIALFVIGCPLISFSQAPALDELRSYPNVRDWTMSDDGAEVFFTLQSSQQHISILAGMKKDRKGRIREFKLPFSGKYNDLEPFLRPDGLRLYFVSNRPESGEGPAKKDFDIWYVERPCRTCEWSDPVNIGAPVNTPGDEFYPIVTKNNHLYFTSTYEHGKGKDDIFMSAFSGGQYQTPVSLPGGINTEGYEFNAFVAPDESFLIFSGYNRPDGMGHGDLYISFNTSGVWSQAVNLGKAFNSPQLDYCPYYDAARQMLYFTSNRSDVVIGEKDELAQILSKLSSYSNGTSRIYKVPFLTTAIQAMLDAQKTENAAPAGITDHHVHVMSPAMIAMWKSMGIPFGKPDAAYADMDSIIQRLGTKNMKLISMAYVYSSSEFGAGQGNIRNLVRAENDYLAWQKAKYPATVEAFYGIDPMADFAMEEIARCNDSLKLDGLKLHFNASQVYLTERKYQEKVKQVLGYAAGHQIPVLLHFDNSHRRFGMPDLEILSDSILAFIPKIHLQIAHLGTSGGFNSRTRSFIDAYLELIRNPAHPLHRHQVVFDVSAVALDKDSDGVPRLDEAAFEELALYLRKIGMDKLVFGTDYPLYSSQDYLDVLRNKVKLSEEEIAVLLRKK